MNHAIKHLPATAGREHRNCRDYRIYENYKRQIAQFTAGDWTAYEKAIAKLCGILGL